MSQKFILFRLRVDAPHRASYTFPRFSQYGKEVQQWIHQNDLKEFITLQDSKSFAGICEIEFWRAEDLTLFRILMSDSFKIEQIKI